MYTSALEPDPRDILLIGTMHVVASGDTSRGLRCIVGMAPRSHRVTMGLARCLKEGSGFCARITLLALRRDSGSTLSSSETAGRPGMIVFAAVRRPDERRFGHATALRHMLLWRMTACSDKTAAGVFD